MEPCGRALLQCDVEMGCGLSFALVGPCVLAEDKHPEVTGLLWMPQAAFALWVTYC